MYTDVEAMIVVWLDTVVDDVRVVAGEAPADLLDVLADLRGLIVVSAFGGAALNPAQERVHLDVDTFAGPDGGGVPDRAGARDLADEVRGAFLTLLAGHTTAEATVQAVGEMSRPTERPYDESPVRRFGGAYRLVVATRG